jgi:hypothetical protein
MIYEVFIPSAEAGGYDVKMTVEADNWMTALKSGLERTGQGAEAIRNVMCDIKQDNSIHVTDASTRRVFVLREVRDSAEDSMETARIDVSGNSPKAAQPERQPPSEPARAPAPAPAPVTCQNSG